MMSTLSLIKNIAFVILVTFSCLRYITKDQNCIHYVFQHVLLRAVSGGEHVMKRTLKVQCLCSTAYNKDRY